MELDAICSHFEHYVTARCVCMAVPCGVAWDAFPMQ